MELFTKFKKDYFNYLISIIIPAFISGISIPLFKHLLGPEGYGNFALWFNAILILTAVLTGWITQSIIRIYPAYPQHRLFSEFSLSLTLRTQFIFNIPLLIVAWWISNDWLLAILCSLTLLVCSLQFTILPIIQSAFLSKKIIYSELMRILIYVGGSALLISFTRMYYLYCLFLSILVSYLVSFIYLVVQRNKYLIREEIPPINKNELTKKFISYGTPLSIWFVFTYLMGYVDKLFTIHLFGATAQGNYQALFDFINKSLILLISPIITSLFPLLTSAYENANRKDIRALLKKIFLLEFAGFLVTSVLYWIFGADLLLFILKTPNNSINKWMGFLIICSTFIWQFSVLVQKKYELQMQTKRLLFLAGSSLLLQVIFYYLFQQTSNKLIAPFGYLIAGIFYMIMVSFPILKSLYRETLPNKPNLV